MKKGRRYGLGLEREGRDRGDRGQKHSKVKRVGRGGEVYMGGVGYGVRGVVGEQSKTKGRR